jgi:hypothetical protein
MPVNANMAGAYPDEAKTAPARVGLRAPPMPCTIVAAPIATLYRPLPRVRSATMTANSGPCRPAPTPSRAWMATSSVGLAVTANSSPRIGSTAKAMSSNGFRPHRSERPVSRAIGIITSCATMISAA